MGRFDWIWPKHFWRSMFRWGVVGNCYGPQPNGIRYEDAADYFGVRAEQLTHNLYQGWCEPWGSANLMVRDVMTELLRQIDVNHGLRPAGGPFSTDTAQG